MAGRYRNAFSTRETIKAYSASAVTANQVLVKSVVSTRDLRIGGVVANAGTAGTGAGNTVLDILVNGTSVYVTTADRPTLASASTGEFTNAEPDGNRALKPGDVVQLKVLSVPASSGHSDLAFTVSLHLAQ